MFVKSLTVGLPLVPKLDQKILTDHEYYIIELFTRHA